MLTKLKLIIVIALLLVVYTLQAQIIKVTDPSEVGMSAERLQRIGQHFQSYLDDNKIAGIQTLVARKGKVVHFETNGYADIDSKKKLEANSIFRIYSMTKPITSVALMMLYEEGKFQLDDPVHKFIPEFKDLKAVVKDDKSGKQVALKEPMQVIDLFRHTSGLGYGWGKGTYVDSMYRVAGTWGASDLTDFTNKVAKLPLYFQSGKRWRYGISTDILGRLVEILSKQPLDKFFKERIFEPLGMSNTFFQVPTDKIERYTTSYQPTKTGGLAVTDPYKTGRFTKDVTMFSGGGGLQSTSYDYLQFCQMLLNGGELNGKRLLSPKTIELMTMDHTKGIPYHGGPVNYPNKAFGFGLGFSVLNDVAATQNLGSVGTYSWGGAAGTYFVIDPVEKIILIQMIQLRPYNHLNHQNEFHTLVYQAIIESYKNND